MVHVAASIAQAASTALPPFSNIIAPAVAAKGLPVIAIQFFPCNGGFCVCCALIERDKKIKAIDNKKILFIECYFDY